MPTTSSSGLRYPASSAAPNVPVDIQNLATDLDTKVIVQVASTTARNALTKYDGLRAYEQSTKRTFRWDATNSRWEQESGPAYTWTPTLQDLSGNPVTGTITSRGTYKIEGAFLQFKADMVFAGTIDGRSGALRLVLPSGSVSRSVEPEQHTVDIYLFTAAIAKGWVGKGAPVMGTNVVALEFPNSSTDCSMSLFRNATGAGVTGSGVPLVSGSYPLTVNSRFAATGRIELDSWTAL